MINHLPHPEGCNIENILKAADLIEKIPQRKFNMRSFRKGQRSTAKCGSVGCIVGHSTLLASNLISRDLDREIDFISFSFAFFGIRWSSNDWSYLFSGDWVRTDNTPTGSASRMRYYAAHGLPENWRAQTTGDAPLIYNTK